MIDPWTEAVREAYASAPTDVRILHTLELRHPTFLDDDGQPEAIRVVLEKAGGRPGSISLRMEADAPLNPSELVDFQKCGFSMTLPELAAGKLPEIEISVDNVTREIMPYLENAVSQRADMEVTYREWLAGDIEGPQYVLHGLTARRIKATTYRVTCTAGFADWLNKRYGELYTVTRFPGLSR